MDSKSTVSVVVSNFRAEKPEVTGIGTCGFEQSIEIVVIRVLGGRGWSVWTIFPKKVKTKLLQGEARAFAWHCIR